MAERRVELIVDGRSLFDFAIHLGESEDLGGVLTGVLRDLAAKIEARDPPFDLLPTPRPVTSVPDALPLGIYPQANRDSLA
jgi:hypothetical protein